MDRCQPDIRIGIAVLDLHGKVTCYCSQVGVVTIAGGEHVPDVQRRLSHGGTTEPAGFLLLGSFPQRNFGPGEFVSVHFLVHVRKTAIVIGSKLKNSHAESAQVSSALGEIRLLSHLLYGRKNERRQDRDNCDDRKKLDKGESE